MQTPHFDSRMKFTETLLYLTKVPYLRDNLMKYIDQNKVEGERRAWVETDFQDVDVVRLDPDA